MNLIFGLVFWSLIQTSVNSPISICCPDGETFANQTCIKSSELGGDRSSFSDTFKGFSLTRNLPQCYDGEILVTLDLSELSTQDDGDYDYVDTPAITDLGFLRYKEEYYSSQEYCIVSKTSETLTIRLCNAKCSGEFPCLPKCCLLNEVIEFSPEGISNCIPSSPNKWLPVLYKNLNTKFGEGVLSSGVHFRLEDSGNWKNCSQVVSYTYTGAKQIDIRILETGEISTCGNSANWEKLSGKYCVDGRAENGVFSGYENDTILLHCWDGSQISRGANYTLGKVYYWSMLISAFFLILTILVYIALWEKHTIHGFSLLSYFISLLTMQIGFIISFIMAENTTYVGNNLRISNACLTVGVFAHFGILWAFAWMTVVNFDLWCTFRNLKSTLTTAKGVKKYMKYFFFALSIPIVIVGFTLGLDLKFGDEMPCKRDSWMILPDYGKRKCYISNRNAGTLYVFIPIGILLSVNIIFFVNTICALKKADEDSSKVGRRTGINRRQSIALIAKLIIVMGVFWVFEAISFFASLLETSDVGSNEVPFYWVILDIANHLHGVIIFIIFVCKRDIIKALRAKYKCIDDIWTSCAKISPCCANEGCGSRHTTTMTLDSDNEGGPYTPKNTKSTKLSDSSRTNPSTINKSQRPILKDASEAITKV